MRTNPNLPDTNIPSIPPQPAIPALQAPAFTTNPAGNYQDVANALQFLFPSAATQAGLTVLTKQVFEANGTAGITAYKADQPEALDPTKTFGSFLSTQTYGTLELGVTDIHATTGNQYTANDGTTKTFKNIVFPIAIIDARQSKNIIKTKITGRDGAIKEYIGMNDWAININTVVNMPADQAPLPFLQGFIQMINAGVSIPVKNYYLNGLGITNIVIEDINLGQAEGGYSSQAVTITASSDVPLESFLP